MHARTNDRRTAIWMPRLLASTLAAYASRYTDTALLVLWLASPADSKGYYLLAGLRARSAMPEGFAARLLRGRIEEQSRSYTEIYPGLDPQEPHAGATDAP